MSNFITKIKRIRTDELIYALSDISIKMYKANMSCTATFPLWVQHYGIYRKVDILLPAWDIPSIEYYSILNSNDYRDEYSVELLPEIINLYRGYEDSLSSNQIKTRGDNDVFRIVMGMTSEQFQYQNLYLMFEKLNRTYHILVAAINYEHRNEIDIDTVFKNIFDFSAEDYLVVLLMVFWLCTQHPDLLNAPENLYRKKDSTVFTKENITKFVEHYSCTYDELRKSSLRMPQNTSAELLSIGIPVTILNSSICLTGYIPIRISFYYIGHFSKFVKKGAKRIGSSKWNHEIDTVSFKNPDGSIVTIVLNMTDKDSRIRCSGRECNGMES